MNLFCVNSCTNVLRLLSVILRNTLYQRPCNASFHVPHLHLRSVSRTMMSKGTKYELLWILSSYLRFSCYCCFPSHVWDGWEQQRGVMVASELYYWCNFERCKKKLPRCPKRKKSENSSPCWHYLARRPFFSAFFTLFTLFGQNPPSNHPLAWPIRWRFTVWNIYTLRVENTILFFDGIVRTRENSYLVICLAASCPSGSYIRWSFSKCNYCNFVDSPSGFDFPRAGMFISCQSWGRENTILFVVVKVPREFISSGGVLTLVPSIWWMHDHVLEYLHTVFFGGIFHPWENFQMHPSALDLVDARPRSGTSTHFGLREHTSGWENTILFFGGILHPRENLCHLMYSP